MEEIPDLVRVLNKTQTYKALGVSDRTGERLEAKGDFPPKTQLSDGRVGYRVSDIKEWLDKRRIVAVLFICVMVVRFFGGAL